MSVHLTMSEGVGTVSGEVFPPPNSLNLIHNTVKLYTMYVMYDPTRVGVVYGTDMHVVTCDCTWPLGLLLATSFPLSSLLGLLRPHGK